MAPVAAGVWLVFAAKYDKRQISKELLEFPNINPANYIGHSSVMFLVRT